MAPWPSRDATPRIRPDCGIRCNDKEQLDAHAAITASLTPEAPRGILHAPCAFGKTLVGLRAAFHYGGLCLFVCHESIGVPQLRELIRTKTTLSPNAVKVFWDADRDDAVKAITRQATHPDQPLYLITTYQTLHTTGTATHSATKRIFHDLAALRWDLVVLDESHHLSVATAANWHTTMTSLLSNATRVLSMTGTLTTTPGREDALRALDALPPDAAAVAANPDLREKALRAVERKEYEPLCGPVVYEAPWASMVDAGKLAKLRLVEVQLDAPSPLWQDANAAIETLLGHCRSPERADAEKAAVADLESQKRRLQALPPSKLEAVTRLIALHQEMGQIGILFMETVQAAEQLQDYLNNHYVNQPKESSEWLLMRGSQDWDASIGQRKDNPDAYGGLYIDPEARFTALRMTNRRDRPKEFSGFICTKVGASAMDFTAHDLRYAILIQSTASPADHAQAVGRLLRPLRDATGAALPASEQKQVVVYDLVSPSERCRGAGADGWRTSQVESRHSFLVGEGFPYTPFSVDDVHELHGGLKARPALLRDADAAPQYSEVGRLVRCLAEVDTDRARRSKKAESNETAREGMTATRKRAARLQSSPGFAKVVGHKAITKKAQHKRQSIRSDSAANRMLASRLVSADAATLRVLAKMLDDKTLQLQPVAGALRAIDPTTFGSAADEQIAAVLATVAKEDDALAADTPGASDDAAPAVAPAVP